MERPRQIKTYEIVASELQKRMYGFDYRNPDMEALIALQVSTFTTLPGRTAPRDLDFLAEQGRILQVNVGLAPKPVIFVEDAQEADYFIDALSSDPSSPWAEAWRGFRNTALDAVDKKNTEHNQTTYHTKLWMVAEELGQDFMPDLHIPKKMARKTEKRIIASAQFNIVADKMRVPNLFNPFVEVARQRAYVIGADRLALRIHTPRT